MAMFVINRHIVVLLETRSSEENRQIHPRARRRYAISCTCAQKRMPDGHCIHTRALLEDSIAPKLWRDITVEQMKAPDNPASSHNPQRATA